MSAIELVGIDSEERAMWLRDLLKSGTYEVTFTKLSGEERVMPCTLQESQLPIRLAESKKKFNAETLSVWCTDRQEWRSFRVMNVTGIRAL